MTHTPESTTSADERLLDVSAAPGTQGDALARIIHEAERCRR